MIDAEREKLLEPWAVRVYQQLQAGYSIPDIQSQFGKIEDATDEDIRWIVDNAKQRYVGYFDYYSTTHKRGGYISILIGIAILVVIFLIVSFQGWPAGGRSGGIAFTSILVGIGSIGYGLYEIANSELKGRRLDVDQL